MKIKVILKKWCQGKDIMRQLKLKKGAKISDALSTLKINPETVVVSRQSKMCMEEERLREGDVIEVLRIISGG